MPRYRISHPDLEREDRITIDADAKGAAAAASRWIGAVLGRPADDVAAEITAVEMSPGELH